MRFVIIKKREIPDAHLTASVIAIFTRKIPLNFILVLASSQVKLSTAGSRSDCAVLTVDIDGFLRKHNRFCCREGRTGSGHSPNYILKLAMGRQ